MEHKEIVIDNDAIVNTEPKELETEPAWIPQGEKPELNPNPGYGDNGETKPAIVTVPVKGEVVVDGGTFTPKKEGVKGIQEIYNFLKGILIKGKPLEEYIDSQGGVTEEELETALATKQDTLVSGTNIKTIGSQSILGSGDLPISGGTKLYKHILRDSNDNEVYIISTRATIYDLESELDTLLFDLLVFGGMISPAITQAGRFLAYEVNAGDVYSLYYFDTDSSNTEPTFILFDKNWLEETITEL